MATYLGNRSAPWKSAFNWLTMFPVTQDWGENGETGVDVGVPYHTEITSLCAGQILGRGYYDGGGVVSVAYTWKGVKTALYYQHLDTIEPGIVAGAAVRAGQKIGLSGGQLIGGSHPSLAKYSTGPHMEVGVNAPYGSMWNPQHYRPNFDPSDLLTALAKGGNTAGAILAGAALGATNIPVLDQVMHALFGGYNTVSQTAGNSGAVMVQATTQPGFIPVAQAIHDLETFRPLDPTNLMGSILHDVGVGMFRLMIVSVGLLIIMAVVFRIAQRTYNGVATGVNETTQAAAGAIQGVGALAGALA